VNQVTRDPRRVLVVCELDGYANGQKPVEIERSLRSRGHDVQMANALYLGRLSSKSGSVLRKLPHPGPRRFALISSNSRHWCSLGVGGSDGAISRPDLDDSRVCQVRGSTRLSES
jgi:hypothetical protein